MNNEFLNENSTTKSNMDENIEESVVESINNNNENENNNMVINENKNGESNNLSRRKTINNDENYLNNGKNEIKNYNNLNEDNPLLKEQNIIKKDETDSSNEYADNNISNNNLESIASNLHNINTALSKQDSGSPIIVNINNVNNNIIISQNNEINNTNNEITINKNNQINNTTNTTIITNTETNNVNIEENINNINATVNNYNTNYFNNSFFNKIECSLNEGCQHDNQTIRVTCIIFKHSYLVFRVVVNTSINTSKWVINAFTRLNNFRKTLKEFRKTLKDIRETIKETCITLIILYIIFKMLRNGSIRKFLINRVKSIFGIKSLPSGTSTEIKPIVTSTPPPSAPTERINFSNNNNLRNKVISGYTVTTNQNSSDIIKYMVKLGNKKINEFYHQLGTFIIDNTKNAYNYTNSMISSSILGIRDKAYPIYNTIYSTEMIQSVLNNSNYVFDKIKGAIVDMASSSADSTKEATTKVAEMVVKTTSPPIITTTTATTHHQNTLSTFFKTIGKIVQNITYRKENTLKY